MEPTPEYSSGPVSDFISISEFNESFDGFDITVTSTDPEEAGTYMLQFFVQLDQFHQITFTSPHFSVEISLCNEDEFASF